MHLHCVITRLGILLYSVVCVVFVSLRGLPRATLAYSLVPDTAVFLSAGRAQPGGPAGVRASGDGRRGERHPLHERRSEEHTSELQSLMRISYAVFWLKKKMQCHKMRPIMHQLTPVNRS